MAPLKPSQRLALLAAPLPASWLLRAVAWSWRVRELGSVSLSSKQPQDEARIYVSWHESTLAMVGAYRDQKVHPFASRSFDGELISRLAGCMGYAPMARGSSSKGGGQGLLELRTYLDAGEHVYITVDGPRGPRREAKEGCLKLAQLSGKAMVPVAYAGRSCPRLSSWDRMLLPPPFCKGVFFFGEELRVPREASSMSSHVQGLQVALNHCHLEAEKAAA